MAHRHFKAYEQIGLAFGIGLMTLAPLGSCASARAADIQPILQVQGALEEGDNVLDEDKSLYDVHNFQGRAGQSVTISVDSTDFDTYVLIADDNGKVLEENDDLSEDNSNSRLTLTLPRDGTYHIIVNGYESKDRGRYNLTVN
ncbi:PPC domain-containing protein [Oscillatoria sp. FACHB-1406]|uniref:PPC domain-containing protein n=1 Tax=Oscillatoria sp. FACHB-1406 TaxID=2692846 RepID=UPI001689FEB7|nr:PPC domain-containing protein [Oscillatoria sp. FACHB-1406]MBD2580657.1 PPC domain-containing protein [Oscillatoria sp. FACHB-1406]